MIGKYVVLYGQGEIVKVLDKLRSGGDTRYLCEIVEGKIEGRGKGDFISLGYGAMKGFAKEWERQQYQKYFNGK